MVNWYWRSFADLKNSELYDILALRQEVFVIEQQCIYKDLDYLDQKATHLLGVEDNKLLAYLRIFAKDIAYPDALSIGRVLTSPSARGKKLGREMMQQALLYLKKKEAPVKIVISAQLYLKKFYESFGFQSIGEPYDEDNILHIKMIREHEETYS